LWWLVVWGFFLHFLAISSFCWLFNAAAAVDDGCCFCIGQIPSTSAFFFLIRFYPILLLAQANFKGPPRKGRKGEEENSVEKSPKDL
jgi:hypothetical protein